MGRLVTATRRITSRDLIDPRPVESPATPASVIILGKLAAWAGLFLVGSIAVLLGSVVIGLAIRILVIVSGVSP